MKILWLYKYLPLYDFDNWLHMRFADYIKNNTNHELIAYGPDLHLRYSNLTPIQFNTEIKIKDIYNTFKFDIIMCCTKSRMFYDYNPKIEKEYPEWLPSDFSSWINTPKIVLEEDYHYEKNDKWYEKNGISLILQRHYSQVLRENIVPMCFFPFSVDTTIFNTHSTSFTDKYPIAVKRGLPLLRYVSLEPNGNRLSKFCFSGNDSDPCYKYRKLTKEILRSESLVDCYVDSERKFGAQYVANLRKYLSYISCGSTYEICAGKNFEIMASGGILFTNKFIGIDLLFPEDSYISYSNDWSDVIVKAKRLLNDPQLQLRIRENALKCINSKHSHDVRIKELENIVTNIKDE